MICHEQIAEVVRTRPILSLLDISESSCKSATDVRAQLTGNESQSFGPRI